MNTETKKFWYVLHTRSKFEKVVHDGLIKKGREVFLPTVITRSRRRDRKRFLWQPLFPGYLFVRAKNEAARRIEILKTVGVVRLIGNRNTPLPVQEEIIDSLKIIVAADATVATGPCFRRGEPVRVVCGPFTGVIGIFSRYLSSEQVVVNIDAMGQSAAIYVQAEDVEPLKSKNRMVS